MEDGASLASAFGFRTPALGQSEWLDRIEVNVGLFQEFRNMNSQGLAELPKAFEGHRDLTVLNFGVTGAVDLSLIGQLLHRNSLLFAPFLKIVAQNAIYPGPLFFFGHGGF